jgi:hypothetical protein
VSLGDRFRLRVALSRYPQASEAHQRLALDRADPYGNASLLKEDLDDGGLELILHGRRQDTLLVGNEVPERRKLQEMGVETWAIALTGVRVNF